MKKILCFAVLVILTALTSAGADTLFYGVKVQVATTQQLQGPFRWTAQASWFRLDQGFIYQPCMLYINTYGTVLPNGFVEFPDNWYFHLPSASRKSIAQTALSTWCLQATEGTTVCLDGIYYTIPDIFGQRIVVSNVYNCS